MESPNALAFATLPALFPEFGPPGNWLPKLERHMELLLAAEHRARSTSVPPAEFARRHYAECLELLRIIRVDSAGTTIVDVGSGGGFPGLVFAIVEPESALHLVEPLQKRARLLVELAAALGLTNVTVYPLRAEEAGRGPLRDSADIVTARAVAPLAELLEYAAPFARDGANLYFPKGSGVAADIAASLNARTVLGCTDPETIAMRPEVSTLISVVSLRKVGPTPPAYPRRPGMPGKSPL